MATQVQQSGAVVGYFKTGHEAHRAIQALVDDGFLPSEIGAAFHVGTGAGREHAEERRSEGTQANVGGSLREELGTTLPGGSTHGNRTGTSGASSDTTAVQYASLGGGAGTPFDGAGRPGPITGSSLANTGLPSELKSELPHDAGLPHGTESARDLSVPFAPEPTARTVAERNTGESWAERLKHIFSSSSHSTTAADRRDTETVPKAPVTAESQNFGTGEGHLILNTGVRYSQPAFERSFSEYGVQPEHARHLSHRIGHGGAIVTVHAAARAIEAERLLEAHGGEVRFSAGSAGQSMAPAESHVEVFGTVGRNYTGYFD